MAGKSARVWRARAMPSWMSFVRNHAETAFHPCGTCKMGCDEMAVVDA